MQQGVLWLHNDINICGAEQHLIMHLGCALLASSAAPLHVHLCADNEIQHEHEASCHKWIVHLLRSGEQLCGMTRDLRDNGNGGELACAAHAVVLCDLRELGEKGEWDSPELRCGECTGRHSRAHVTQ